MNCGFETNSFPPWVQSGDLSFTSIDNASARTGNAGLDTGPTGDLGFITQMINTSGGGMYVLHFWLLNLGGTPNRFQVSWGGNVIADSSNLPPTPYTEYCIQDLPPSGAMTALRFGFLQVPSLFYFDDVVVVPQ